MLVKRFPLARIYGGYQPLENPRIAGLLKAQNARMHLGVIEKRNGLAKFGSQATTDAVIAMATANYGTGQDLFRMQADKIHRYNSGSWVDATPSGETISTTKWTSAMTYEIFYCSPGYVFNAANSRGIIKQSALGGALTGVDNSPGANFLIGYAGRLFAIGIEDLGGTDRPYRVMWTAVGNFDDWTTAANGAGDIDLSTDGFPVQVGVVSAGRLLILKGNASGGSVVVCTSTYDAVIPLTFEPIYGAGILCPKTLVTAGMDINLFLGHDHFYAINSARVSPLEHPTAEMAVSRVNPDRAMEGFSYYIPETGDVRFVLPVGTSDLEAYTYNIRTKVWAGPETLNPKLVSATGYVDTEISTWNDALGHDWDSVLGTSWDSVSYSTGPERIILGSSDGWVYDELEGYYDDAGTTYTVELETGDYDFVDQKIAVYGKRYPQSIESGDELVASGLLVEYKNTWSPTIYLSADGGASWTQIHSGELPGSDAHNEKFIQFPDIPGTRFRVKITHASGSETLKLVGLKLQVRWLRRAVTF